MLSRRVQHGTEGRLIQGRIREFALRGPVPSVPSSSRPLPFRSPFPSCPLPLEVEAPLNQLRGLGERYELHQRVPGRSPDRKRIWCCHNTLYSTVVT